MRAFDGLMSFTPDGMPLIGEAAAARGLWLCEAIWVTHAGGAGRALAELIARGDVRTDLHECDPQRFDAHGLSRTYARARGAQQYREVYDVIHPRQQSEQVRALRRTPLHARQLELGAHFFESAGWERPQWFAANAQLDPGEVLPRHAWAAQEWSPIAAAEHRACRERVGLFDLSPFTKVEVRGPGALAFLQGLAGNDVDRPVGTIVYTAMCAPRGGIMCDLTITRTAAERFLVVTGGAVGRHDIAWMTRHLPWDGSVQLEDKTSGLCCIGVWGPRARDLVAALAEEDVGNAAFPYMTARELHLGAVPVRALRISYVGELGWEIYAPTEFGVALWDLLWEAGAPHGVVACGGAAYDSLRLEKGYRLWGQDIDEEHDPYEAGLGWAVKLDKGPFVGRDVLARVKERGPQWRLRCLVTDDPTVVLAGKEPILDGDAVVGYVTSAALGASVGQSILYGYLPVGRAEIGTALSVYAEGERYGVTVAAEPLFDPAQRAAQGRRARAGRRRRLTQRAHRQEQHHVDGEAEHGAELRLDEREHLRDEDRHDERLLEAAVGALAMAAAERDDAARHEQRGQRARGEAGDVHEPEVGEAVGAEAAVRGAELDAQAEDQLEHAEHGQDRPDREQPRDDGGEAGPGGEPLRGVADRGDGALGAAGRARRDGVEVGEDGAQPARRAGRTGRRARAAPAPRRRSATSSSPRAASPSRSTALARASRGPAAPRRWIARESMNRPMKIR